MTSETHMQKQRTIGLHMISDTLMQNKTYEFIWFWPTYAQISLNSYDFWFNYAKTIWIHMIVDTIMQTHIWNHLISNEINQTAMRNYMISDTPFQKQPYAIIWFLTQLCKTQYDSMQKFDIIWFLIKLCRTNIYNHMSSVTIMQNHQHEFIWILLQ